MKALEGIVVLDLTTAYSGPFASMQLADHGAEVIKIENHKGGDQTRIWEPLKDGVSAYFAFVNRNKKSITLNLRSERGKEIFLELVKQADVVMENYRGGTMEKMGLGYEKLKSVNPGIIMASLSGFGQTGPLKQQGAFASIAEALSGVMNMTGFPDGPPTATGNSTGDSMTGAFTVIGILMALIHRAEKGEGQYIDVAMTDTMFHAIENAAVLYSVLGEEPVRNGNRDVAGYPYDCFEAKDGYCILSVANTNDWSPFAKAIGREELIEDPRFLTNSDRKKNEDELFEIISNWTKQLNRKEIEEIFYEYGLLYAPVLKVSEVVEHEQLRGREMIVEMEDPNLGKYIIQGVPVKMSLTPGSVDKPAPGLGEHNLEIYERIGLSPEELQELKSQQII